ncbi:FMN-dependent NADH-azoreductase [Pandoraea faecigallinarum]|uniref:FMN dependent NADH:quinone oxidoreductase n=1 Tax=Pandoraea faecigallinarum TaxID=656179 RepID=A0A0H3WSM2_9BURK|nr:NAD(P)H-dependent oxidoreductase [Pandoraea faecigallinarum]AKM31179.1 FMN-dependent NADH-azoreductase [Pandoraea faecigallinarum]
MTSLLLNASPHGASSRTFGMAQTFLDEHAKLSGDGEIIVRDLATFPLPAITSDYAAAITSRTPDPAHFALSEHLIEELEATSFLAIATPMHNFTVPASLKLWIDYVVRIGRSFASTPQGKVGLLKDRPSVVIVGSGGFHTGENARQPDFLTPYLRHALGCIGIHDVTFFLMQGLVAGSDAGERALAACRSDLARYLGRCVGER